MVLRALLVVLIAILGYLPGTAHGASLNREIAPAHEAAWAYDCRCILQSPAPPSGDPRSHTSDALPIGLTAKSTSNCRHPRTSAPNANRLNATRGASTAPNRIYSARELIRRAAELGPFQNFPESFNRAIFDRGARTVTPNFFNKAKAGLSNDSVMYRLRGTVNGAEGTFEIGARPSLSGQTEVISHRFFRPD